MISQQALIRFRQLYKQRYGVELTDAEALRRATSLIQIYTAVYGSPLECASHQDDTQAKSNDDHGE